MKSPAWIFVLFTISGLFAGATYLHKAWTEGPVLRNLIIGGIWIAMGGFWLFALAVRRKAARLAREVPETDNDQESRPEAAE